MFWQSPLVVAGDIFLFAPPVNEIAYSACYRGLGLACQLRRHQCLHAQPVLANIARSQ